jgi:NodT family efflux transporter outer membrane factor (OMF) lipoprotein
MKPSSQFHAAAICLPPIFALLLASAGCVVGPNYKRPAAAVPPAFKEQPPANFKEAEAAGWKQSQPGDAYFKGRWWELYNDAALNALEEQVGVSNQNVLQAEAQYREARAAVGVARAALFPIVSTSPAISTGGSGATAAGSTSGTSGTGTAGTGTSGSGTSGSGTAGTRTSFSLPFNVSWEPDLWGNIRRGVTASAATAQSLAAAVANARLLYQAELAQDYFELHGSDAEADLLTRTAASYEEYLTLTQNRFKFGIASDLDVAQAETQLYGVQSQLIDLGVQRAAFEHAIAILIGKAPAEVTIPPVTLNILPPPVPTAVPSELLERRPDIAGSERLVAAANEQIGIAMSAFYPNLSLTGSAGLESSSIAKWFTWPSRFWSVGPQLAETLFDAGRRRGVVVEQRAAYDATVAAYRETVLTAMQQVEDNLAALRILEGEAGKIEQTVQSATRALDVSSAQYKAGTASYLTVITSQATLLNADVTAVNLLTRRLTASVLLIEALGGGWNASQLPTKQDVAARQR